jgi:hypothetical protein
MKFYLYIPIPFPGAALKHEGSSDIGLLQITEPHVFV